MRIPTSVFVMGALTCVPFGLAIRDTLNTRAAHADRWGDDSDSDDGDPVARDRDRIREHDLDDDVQPPPSAVDLAAQAERDRRDLEAARAEADRQRAEEAAAAVARAKIIPTLIGAKPGALGAAFAGIHVGSPITDDTYVAIDHISTGDLRISTLAPAQTLDGIFLTVTSEDSGCHSLADPMIAAWGQPTQLDLDHDVWLDPAGGRTSLNVAACSALLDRAVTIDKFIDRGTTAVVPLGVIGMPATKLATQLGARADVDADNDTINWEALGLAEGAGATSLLAKTHAGKVIGLTASGTTSAAALAALQARLTKLLGAPTANEFSDDMQWKGKPGAVLSASGTSFRLELGDVNGPADDDAH